MTIVSWNMQGAGLAVGITKTAVLYDFFEKGFDVICLQEMTEPLPTFSVRTVLQHGIIKCHQAVPARTNLRDRPSQHYTCYYKKWGEGNMRCSLAIYTRLPMHSCGIETYDDAIRPMLWIRFATGNMYIGNVHLPSGVPELAEPVFNYFKLRMEAILFPTFRYAIVGDFNMSLPYIAEHYAPTLERFHHSRVATHQNNNILDYIYYNGMADPVRPSETFHSDHRYIYVRLQ